MMTDSVAHYYDRNSRWFLRLGGGGPAAAIHRAVWAPGVSDRRAAFEYLNRLTAEAVAPVLSSTARLLDLGCGVGGTAAWMAQRPGVEVIGVTNSSVQLEMARRHARTLGLEHRCRFVLADFNDLPELGRFDAAYAIEAFVHAADPERFFAQAAARLAPGGRLVICDDFLASPATAGQDRSRALRRFTAGWRIHTLIDAAEAQAVAAGCGLRLIENRDLTPYLRFFHPLVLRSVYAVTRLQLRSEYWNNLSGGSALQVCIRSGWTGYRALVFMREEVCTP